MQIIAEREQKHLLPRKGISLMKRIIALAVIALAIGSVSVIVFAQLSNKSQRKTPALTTDDVVRKSPSRKSTETAGGSIRWETNLDSALNLAKADNKVVIVDVYTDWCGWCKKMDKVIYADPAIVSLSREQVFLKFDAEDGGQGQQFAKRMGVRGYPTTIILNSDGERLKAQSGFMGTPERFIQFVESARASR